MVKYCSIIGLIFIALTSCKQEQSTTSEAEFNVKDTLNLPHFPYLDYNLQFEKSKINIFEFYEKQSFVKNFYQDFWDFNQVSGGLLVAKNGKVIYENYRGYSNFETGDTLTAETPIHIASISKVMTALAIMKLIEEDKIKLDQLVSHLFPVFPYNEITIRDLLSHRSGLPNYAYFQHDDNFWNTETIKSNQDVFQALVNQVALPYSAPNKNFSYCNTNYVLLALIIEKVTGLDYARAMKYILFDPLQMNHTFVFNIADSTRVSQSYGSGGTRWEFDYLDQIYGDKNIYSTPRDLFKLDKAMYAKEFLKSKWKKQMKKGYSNEKKGVKNYGLGIRMMEWESGEKLLYHNGWWHGNYTTYVRGEADTVTIIALGNKQNRAVYSAFSLAGMLGNYPLIPETTTRSMASNSDSTQIFEDTLLLTHDKVENSGIKVKKKPSGNIKPSVFNQNDSSGNRKRIKINLDKLDSLKQQLSYNH